MPLAEDVVVQRKKVKESPEGSDEEPLVIAGKKTGSHLSQIRSVKERAFYLVNFRISFAFSFEFFIVFRLKNCCLIRKVVCLFFGSLKLSWHCACTVGV